MKTRWSVTVVYEDEAKRAEATRFCDQLVKQSWEGAELDLHWWSLAQLQEPNVKKAAVDKATEADVIVVAIHPASDIPLEPDCSMADWLARRGDHEGILVGLLGDETTSEAEEKHLRLRKIARRGGLDYLTGAPEYVAQRIPDSFEPYHDRAHRMTSVIDDILHHPPIPHLTS